MEQVLTEIVGEKYVADIILSYIDDLKKYERLQQIDNGIIKEMEEMRDMIELDTKPVKHLISKKLLRLEQDMGVNVAGDSSDDDNEDMSIKRYYERKIGLDSYDLQYCRDHIIGYSKDRYKLLGKKEFDNTPIVTRDDFIVSDIERDSESDSDSDDDERIIITD